MADTMAAKPAAVVPSMGKSRLHFIFCTNMREQIHKARFTSKLTQFPNLRFHKFKPKLMMTSKNMKNAKRSNAPLNWKRTNNERYIGQGVIWSFWEGDLPELVVRCLASMKAMNPRRAVIIVDKEIFFPLFLEPEDYPMFNGERISPDEFSQVQYLADWVRLALLYKYGGIWFDASTICTNAVESWVDNDGTKLTIFPMHANPNVYGNWAMACEKPGHRLIAAWLHELSLIFNECGPSHLPAQYIRRAFKEHEALEGVWNHPEPPPLPYLWVYLALQVVLQKQAKLRSTIFVLPSSNGPMFRRHLYNVRNGIRDPRAISQQTADDLATRPLRLRSHDKWFIKLVGSDRPPLESHLKKGTFLSGSALDSLYFWSGNNTCQSIVFGKEMHPLKLGSSIVRNSFHGTPRRRSSVASAA